VYKCTIVRYQREAISYYCASESGYLYLRPNQVHLNRDEAVHSIYLDYQRKIMKIEKQRDKAMERLRVNQ